jgi:aldehyde:ferredoxin oxidoreductase
MEVFMPYGYTGRILHVNLTEGSLVVEQPPEAFYRKYMGGSAMGMYYVLRDTPPGLNDPEFHGALLPENVLTIMTSVTTGTPISGQSRINVNAKSPLSGAIGDSQAGGFFPAELKFSGFDGIVVKGSSPHPVYLKIVNGEASLHDAAHLKGKTTAEVDEQLRQEIGEPKAEIMQVGMGAENGVRFASIVNMANRNNGRTGMGLVMHSKNLKAIVVRGKQPVKIANKEAFSALSKAGPPAISAIPDMDGLAKHGTAGVVMFQNMIGTLPTRNYNEGQFTGAEPISGEKMTETILIKRDTCFACAVRCKRVVEITQEPYNVDPVYGGPEYETIGTFGSYCAVDDLAAVSKASQICNMYGVDTITCGATIAFAMECFEKGIIGLEQTGGIDLRFGNAEAMLEVLQQIVTASGALGPLLSQGSAWAAQAWGPAAEECLITVKNQEAPAHMPNAKRSLGLIYAVNPFGADHQSSEHDPYYEEGAAKFNLDRLEVIDLKNPTAPGSLGHEKIRFAVNTQVFYSILDSLELCQFVWGPTWTLYGPVETVELVRAVTGWDITLDELMKLGERRINMLRLFNAREGFDRKDDTLPKKFFKPLQGTGPTAGSAMSVEELDTALDQYYQLMGWSASGLAPAEKLVELGLDWAA